MKGGRAKYSRSSVAKAPAKSKPQYVYSLNLKNGRKYVGKTTNLEGRLTDHFTGNGAAWTRANPPVSINHIQKCRNAKTAAKAETIVYHKLKDYHGMHKVRGAGHTKSV